MTQEIDAVERHLREQAATKTVKDADTYGWAEVRQGVFLDTADRLKQAGQEVSGAPYYLSRFARPKTMNLAIRPSSAIKTALPGGKGTEWPRWLIHTQLKDRRFIGPGQGLPTRLRLKDGVAVSCAWRNRLLPFSTKSMKANGAGKRPTTSLEHPSTPPSLLGSLQTETGRTPESSWLGIWTFLVRSYGRPEWKYTNQSLPPRHYWNKSTGWMTSGVRCLFPIT